MARLTDSRISPSAKDLRTAGAEASGKKRVIISGITPVINCGQHPVKGLLGEPLTIGADIFADGHDVLFARALVRNASSKGWMAIPMRFIGNDAWEAGLNPTEIGYTLFKIQAWICPLKTWFRDYRLKQAASADLSAELITGIRLLENHTGNCPRQEQKLIGEWVQRLKSGAADPLMVKEEDIERWSGFPSKERMSSSSVFKIFVDRPRAGFGAWYELFPRSCVTESGRHGTFKEVAERLPDLAAAGFDVLYLPPIHPIGKTNRKGRNNALRAEPGDPGSPWAIGDSSGGHTAIHPELGSLADFKKLLRTAARHNIEIALDIAFQCSPDHPYVKAHPEWFRWRPDGSVQFAENPPKKYEDILPFDFECAAWVSLWEELLQVFLFWIKQGIRIFRVDNPHTKSLRFWAWLLEALRQSHPDVLLLSEAFTRPKVMEHLAMIGFTQSYTYFTWRNSRQELEEYMNRLTRPPVSLYFRPNFWPNTPDILPAHLVEGGENMHIIRFLLAATLSSNYGIYGPVYERTVNRPAAGKEEYADNEKYEIKFWAPAPASRTWQIISRVNRLRRSYKALQTTSNLRFLKTSNDQLIAFLKWDTADLRHLMVVISLDPYHPQSGWLDLPVDVLPEWHRTSGIVTDLLHAETYTWNGDKSFILLDPDHKPAHILSLDR